MNIARITEAEPPLGTLVAESEAQGLSFVRRLADEWASGANRFDRPGEALFVAREGLQTVGVAGLNVDPYAGDSSVGRLRHLYVLPALRRQGVGGNLVAAVVDAAAASFRTLRLHTSDPDAARLYERMGFRRRADVGRCTHVMELAPSTHGDALLQAIAPQFLVDDLESAVAYYRDRLGFRVDFVYEGFYAAVSRDGVLIHLKCAPKTLADREHRKRHGHLDAYVAVSGVHALYEELRSRGAWVLTPLTARPWGHTDFLVEDVDGYIVCFSGPGA